MYVLNNAITGNNLSVLNNTFIQNYLTVNNDVSFNNKLFVANNTLLNQTLTVGNNAFFNNDVYFYTNEWVSGNVNITRDISLNRNQYIGNNLFVAKDISLNGNLFANGNVTIGTNSTNILNINSKTNILSDISINSNVYVSKTAYINNLSVIGNQEISGNFFANGSLMQIGNSSEDILTVLSSSAFIGDSTMENVIIQELSCNIIKTDYIKNSNNLIIGEDAQSITIGNLNTKINMSSNIAGSLSTSGKNVILNIDTSNNFSAYDAGIYINEYNKDKDNIITNNNYAAFFATSHDRNQVKFKAPASTNIVSIGMNDISLNLSTNNNGILILKKFNDEYCSTDEGITHQINVSSFDISNILQRSMSESTSKNQVVTTNVSIKGNLIINNSITSTTAALDVSGNFFHSNGWITQF